MYFAPPNLAMGLAAADVLNWPQPENHIFPWSLSRDPHFYRIKTKKIISEKQPSKTYKHTYSC